MTSRPEDIAWLSGILEGEGSFFITWKVSSGGAKYPAFKIQCNMCDKDIIDRIYDIAKIGLLRGPLPVQKSHHRPAYSWSVNRRAHIKEILEAIRPYMGERRGERIALILSTMEDHPPMKRWRHGTRQGYEVGCHCADCRAAHAARFRRRRARIRAAGYIECAERIEEVQ